jgi:hypothetical protein
VAGFQNIPWDVKRHMALPEYGTTALKQTEDKDKMGQTELLL